LLGKFLRRDDVVLQITEVINALSKFYWKMRSLFSSWIWIFRMLSF
jgi:hypothetical protein